MTKTKNSAILDASIFNLSQCYTLPAEVLSNSDSMPIELDMGCGKGSFTTELAKRHPENNYVGIEKYSSVLLRALEKMDKEEHNNYGTLSLIVSVCFLSCPRCNCRVRAVPALYDCSCRNSRTAILG